jgi:hypothetical protein
LIACAALKAAMEQRVLIFLPADAAHHHET